MDEKTIQIAKDIRDIIGQSKDYTRASNPQDLFIQAETIIGSLAFLISPVMEMETAYRQEIAQYISEGESVAKAEAKAKAGVKYLSWKKLEMLYNLAHEQVMLLKKFQQDLSNEYMRTK